MSNKFLDIDGLKEFKKKADDLYLTTKSATYIKDKINLTTETKISLAAKYALLPNNSINFYVIADKDGKLPSSQTRINVNSDITSLVGAEGANVGDIFIIGKLTALPVYKIVPLNDAKAATSSYKGTNGVMTPWDKTRVNKVDTIETTANNALNNLPTGGETNMNNALTTGVYPWCTLGRPSGSTGAYTCVTLASTTKDGNGYQTIEQTAYGRQGELGRVFKRIVFKSDSTTQYGDWLEVTNEDIEATVQTVQKLSKKVSKRPCKIACRKSIHIGATEENGNLVKYFAYNPSIVLQTDTNYVIYLNDKLLSVDDMVKMDATINKNSDGSFRITSGQNAKRGAVRLFSHNPYNSYNLYWVERVVKGATATKVYIKKDNVTDNFSASTDSTYLQVRACRVVSKVVYNTLASIGIYKYFYNYIDINNIQVYQRRQVIVNQEKKRRAKMVKKHLNRIKKAGICYAIKRYKGIVIGKVSFYATRANHNAQLIYKEK